MNSKEVLEEASRLVTGDREKSHGPKLENHTNICTLWSAYLGKQLTSEITPHQAAVMMALLKIARTKAGEPNSDDLVDAAAYCAIAEEVR